MNTLSLELEASMGYIRPYQERDHLPRDRLQMVGPVQRKKLKARQACRVKMLEEDAVASNS